MLFLTRKKNEVIQIGDNIEIMVTEIRGDKVKLGITAPKEIGIIRPDAVKKPTKQYKMIETIPNQKYLAGQSVVATTLGGCDSGGAE